MRSWLVLLGGLLVWTVHFFGVYAIGEIDPRVAWVIALTLVCLAANVWLLFYVARMRADEHFSRWRRSVAAGGAGLSLVAVVWQSLAVLAH
jgi:hypothetical protein